MKNRSIAPIWHARVEEIRKLAANGMFDHEIGKLYGVTAATIYNVRWNYNIPANRQRKRKPKPADPPKVKKIKRNGQIITICPPMYAQGALLNNYVRPRDKG